MATLHCVSVYVYLVRTGFSACNIEKKKKTGCGLGRRLGFVNNSSLRWHDKAGECQTWTLDCTDGLDSGLNWTGFLTNARVLTTISNCKSL